MTEKIWTVAQLQKLHDLQEKYSIPQTVVNEIERITKILDSCYGSGRDVDNEDGGYVLLIIPDSTGDWKPAYLDVLRQNCLCPDRAEIESVLCMDNFMEWHSDLFLTSNEYGIIVIYPLGRKAD